MHNPFSQIFWPQPCVFSVLKAQRDEKFFAGRVKQKKEGISPNAGSVRDFSVMTHPLWNPVNPP